MDIQILSSASYSLSPYGVPPFIIGLLTAALGVVVLVRERSSLVSLTFLILTWIGAAWLVSYLGMYSAQQESVALWWAKTQNVAVVFIPSAIYFFTLAFAGQIQQRRVSAFIALGISSLFCFGITSSDWFIPGIYHHPWGNYTRYGPLSIPFLAFFFCMTVVNLRLLWTEYKHTRSRIQQHRLKAFLVALGIAYTGSVDFLPAFGIPVFPSGYLAIFAFLVLAARVIWRYRLVDLTPAFAAKQILRTMADALLVLDREGIVRVVNQAACQLFEYPERELVGKPLWTISTGFIPRDRLQRALRSGVIQRYETTYSFKSGEKITLDVSLSAIPDQESESIGIVCIARDITERKQSDQVPYDKAAQ